MSCPIYTSDNYESIAKVLTNLSLFSSHISPPNMLKVPSPLLAQHTNKNPLPGSTETFTLDTENIR